MERQSVERRSVVRLDLESRNQRILVLYSRHIHRKRIAMIMKMQYDAVVKVIQKYQTSSQNEIVRHNESCDVGFRHSDR